MGVKPLQVNTTAQMADPRMPPTPELPADISSTVRRALNEDIGTGDLTASLLPTDKQGSATVLSREPAVLCGMAWFDEVFRQLDDRITVAWLHADGDEIGAGTIVCRLSGPVRPLLTGERTALNFLQLLSGTATATRRFVHRLEGTTTKLLDTRKTIPGLRSAQKYAVVCGGGQNHRMGLYDAILIKDNHLRAAGGVAPAVRQAKSQHRRVEVEVETLQELEEAIAAGADTALLDNFSQELLRRAVAINAGRVRLEVSGGVDLEQLRMIAATGVDYISVGAITKHVRAIDFTMELEQQ